MDINLDNVLRHIEAYFKKYLPGYSVLEARRKSYHPDDDHLYMVSARKGDGTFAVWTSWNEQTQSLNHGHYGLRSIEDCEEIFAAFQNDQQYFAVYKCSQNAKSCLFTAKNEEEAKSFCEQHDWEYKDENDFLWNLDYSEVNAAGLPDGKEP